MIGLFALLSAGFLAGVGGIATVQRRLRRVSARAPPIAGGESTTAMSAAELAEHRSGLRDARRAGAADRRW